MSALSQKKFPRLGRKYWVIAEGYIPEYSHGPEPEMTSHESFCVLNSSNKDARLEVWIFYEDRDPVGPYRISVKSRRTNHVRFNNLKDPEPIPRGKDFASIIESNVPIVVQHTRLDSRQSENALISTIAFGGDD